MIQAISIEMLLTASSNFLVQFHDCINVTMGPQGHGCNTSTKYHILTVYNVQQTILKIDGRMTARCIFQWNW